MSSFNKIGPHILSRDMLDGVFHYRDAVLKNIESIRNVAREEGTKFQNLLRTDPPQAIMNAKGYSNAVSILGSRGSGKTSIIMTLRKFLEDENANHRIINIMMPLLAPQDFAESDPLLGWVVSHILKLSERIVSELNSCPYDHSIQSCRRDKRSQSYGEPSAERFQECMDALLNAFSLRSQRTLGDHSIRLPEHDQVYYYIESIKQDTELQASLLKLISEIIDYYKDLNERSYSFEQTVGNEVATQEPLLVFAIDDLDLTPGRSTEVVELILRYLQHPNVVVLCGWNLELFQNHLTMDLLKAQGVLDADTIDKSFDFNDVFMSRYRKQTTAVVSAKRLALDSLKKAFPPAQRYEIRSLSISERASFPYAGSERAENRDQQKTSSTNNRQTLFQMIKDAVRSCAHSTSGADAASFLQNDKGEDLIVYTRIFDNRARGLINVYKAFETLKNNQDKLEQETESEEWDITEQVKILLDTILFSNTRFAPYRRGIRDLVQIQKVIVARIPGETTKKGERKLEYLCDFEAVETIYNKFTHDGEIAEMSSTVPFAAEHFMEQQYDYFPNLVIDVLLLLNFMENFLHSITQTKGSSHGGREFSKLLNTVNKPLEFKSQPDSPLKRAIELSNVKKLWFFPDTDDFSLNISLLNAYEKYGFEENRYQFTGFYSMEHIFRLIKDQISTMDGELDDQKVESIVRADVSWFVGILTLFRDLSPNRENVRRYGAYVSLLNSLDGKREEAQERANSINWTQEHLLSAPPTQMKPLPDSDLDTIVYCLRLLDRNRQIISRWSPKVGDNSTIQSALLRAKAVLNIKNDFPDTPSVENLNAEYLNERYSSINNFRLYEYESNDTNPNSAEETIRAAQDRTIKDITFLLHALESQLKTHIWAGYHNLRRSKSKILMLEQRFLLQIGVILNEYVERWELNIGTWGKKEEDACFTLLSVFQDNLLMEQASAVTSIRTMGNNLRTTARQRYTNAVGNIRQWVSGHAFYFNEKELEKIRSAILVLDRAPQKIRRDLLVEENIYNVLIKMEELVAVEYGLLCERYFQQYSFAESYDEKQASERQSIWPVHIRYDKTMKELGTVLQPLVPQTSIHKKSLFDASYSEIKLFLRASGNQ